MSLDLSPSHNRVSAAALSALIILQTVMLASLYAGVPPHPPAAIPLFGIGPLLGASLSAAVAAILLGSGTSRAGRGFGLAAAALALISFGPQKYFDSQIGLIWPAVLTGQFACLVLVGKAVAAWRGTVPVSTDPATGCGNSGS